MEFFDGFADYSDEFDDFGNSDSLDEFDEDGDDVDYFEANDCNYDRDEFNDSVSGMHTRAYGKGSVYTRSFDRDLDRVTALRSSNIALATRVREVYVLPTAIIVHRGCCTGWHFLILILLWVLATCRDISEFLAFMTVCPVVVVPYWPSIALDCMRFMLRLVQNSADISKFSPPPSASAPRHRIAFR